MKISVQKLAQFRPEADAPQQIRDLFAWAVIEEVMTTYTIAGGGKAREGRAELLISATYD